VTPMRGGIKNEEDREASVGETCQRVCHLYGLAMCGCEI